MAGRTLTRGGTAQGTAGNAAGKNAPAPAAFVPFIRASAEHRESVFDSGARAVSAAGTTDLGSIDIPPYGFLRGITLVVTGAGFVGGTFAEDGPWNILQNIMFGEPNGANINQFDTGYSLMLANKYGGYRHPMSTDPRSNPVFLTDAAGNFTFFLRLPFELSGRDALGSLPNQNSGATFKLRLVLASAATGTGVSNVYSALTTPGTVRVQAFMEAWDQPESNVGGMTNQTAPPANNTTQFWSATTYTTTAGFNQLRLNRIGNYCRNLILINRRAGNSRVNGDVDMPNPLTLYLDVRPLDTIERNNWTNQMWERTGMGGRAPAGSLVAGLAKEVAGGLDNGVWFYDFCHEFDQGLGRENRDLWLPTLGSSRVELQGLWGNAGALTVLTNDVAPVGSVFL